MINQMQGPLRIHPENGRYFTDNSGRAIYLTGSHTWANLQDIGLAGGEPFPYNDYLDFMESHQHNFMRFWMFEQPEKASWTDARITFDPLPWARTGPGIAEDGKPKYDLGIWNEDYFQRMRQRIIQAGDRGIYTAIMLFQGWSLHKTNSPHGDPWPFHPFNGNNNINGVDVPFTQADDDFHACLHSLKNPSVMSYQEAYVRKVIDTVNDLDNVLYEIINEGGATDWQYALIELIHKYENQLDKQHPVGMTHRISPVQYNQELFDSPAEWISPAQEPQDWIVPGSTFLEDYRNDPPVGNGKKVILTDTDHLWGHGANPKWVWKSFLRGLNPIFMDPWWPLYIESNPEVTPWAFVGGITKDQRDYPDWEPTRRAMGDTSRFASRVNLVKMLPRPELASTRYCLADPGEEYLVYLPDGGSVTVNLLGTNQAFKLEWFFPAIQRTYIDQHPIHGGGYKVLTAPYTGESVAYLVRKHE